MHKVGLLFASFCLSWASSPLCAAPLPLGRNLPGVRFDAKITEWHGPLRKRVTLYVRYWVTPTAYQMQIIWAEPNGADLDFPFYAPGLLVRSTSSEFGIEQQWSGNGEDRYDKPIPQRPPLRYMFGEYQPSNMRSDEAELSRNRIAPAAIEVPGRTNDPATGLGETGGQGAGRKRTFDASFSDGRLDALNFLDYHASQTASNRYRYAADQSSDLEELDTLINEGRIEVGFRGAGIKTWANGVTNTFRELLLPRNKGGRVAKVLYKRVADRDADLKLPELIEIRNAQDGNLLRSADITDFKCFTGTPSTEEMFSDGAVDFSRDFVGYLALMRRYRSRSCNEVTTADRGLAIAFLDRFRNNVRDAGCLGEKLQRCGVMLDLARLLDDVQSLDDSFREYLGLLGGAGDRDLALVGGYAIIEKSVLSGDFN